jgi:hypothetical protein
MTSGFGGAAVPFTGFALLERVSRVGVGVSGGRVDGNGNCTLVPEDEPGCASEGTESPALFRDVIWRGGNRDRISEFLG